MSDQAPFPIARAIAVALALTAAVVGTSRALAAQELATWRARHAEQLARVTEAARRYQEDDAVRRDYDRSVAVEGLRISYFAADVSADDSAAFVEGLRAGVASLRSRFGDAGAGLAAGASWYVTRSEGRLETRLILERADELTNRTFIDLPVRAAQVEEAVLGHAGDRLTRITPGLRAYAGYSAFQTSRVHRAEIARRLATSWASVGRHCATGALDACAATLAPFDPTLGVSRYFDVTDYRAAVVSSRLPPLTDSLFADQRRQCLRDGSDSACAALVHRVDLVDPFNPFVRGSLLTHALDRGGDGAVARILARRDAPPLDLLAEAAGLTVDSLLASWHRDTFAALEAERPGVDWPLLASSVAWAGLLLTGAMRRRLL